MTQVNNKRSNVQKILKVRRHYNQWVADQTLEDYALRFTARKSRHMSISKVGKTALGATAFLALESIAASITLAYGFTNTIAAIVVVCLIFFLTGLPITYYSARYGLDIDLLTRGAGFGYLGSTITSLIYASFTFIFFAIEAAILSSALYLLFGIPLTIGYIICAVAVIPIVVKGITAISKFQLGTQTLWLVLQIAALLVVFANEWRQFNDWVAYTPVDVPSAQGFSWVLFGAAASVLFALVAQIGEQVDYLRFMPEKTEKNKKSWWFWIVLAGPGWVSVGMVKMLLGSFLAYLAISQGMSAMDAADPTKMYQRAFGYFIQSDQIALIFAALMVIISQMKINVTNAYAGSIAWSNFFSRLTHSHPGRVVWLVFNVMLALLLMELGVHKALEAILSVFALVAVSWLCCLSADLIINKPLGLSPKHIEFKRGHLYDINPVGTVSMVLASGVGFLAYLGVFGEGLKTLGHFLSIATCFVSVPFIAWLTKGRYYLARQGSVITTSGATQYEQCECSICQNELETEDLLFCPAYQQTICSLCCSLDSRCLDQCKPANSSLYDHLRHKIPTAIAPILFGRTGRFFVWFSLVNTFIAALLALIHKHMALQNVGNMDVFSDGLWTLFFTLMIVSGVVTWLFLLSHESRVVAQQESNRQTQKLLDEIDAHNVTDEQLQQAKDMAERANAAKSRYLSGISHELRTPLQSILGYAQLLSEREDTPQAHQSGLKTIHRSGQYLADLIEGLLDVSKIEAGRLDLHMTHFNFPDLVQQLANMFQMQAQAKNINLKLVVHDSLPTWVNSDEKRLRQVLINVLSNAIKYTEKGSVEFHVRYRTLVAEFEIIDTGVGINPIDQERIFSPFERVIATDGPAVAGTGLGLTIVKLLVEIMGGDIQLSSTPGEGSQFKVVMMLPSVAKEALAIETQQIARGYSGATKTLAVVDDDPVVRVMLNDLFEPLGFDVWQSYSAKDCLAHLDSHAPDIFILDVNMGDMDGFELAQALRRQLPDCPILMLSANAQIPDDKHRQLVGYNEYLVKPINNHRLLQCVSDHLDIEWLNSTPRQVSPTKLEVPTELGFDDLVIRDSAVARELLSALDIGYKTGVKSALLSLFQADELTQTEYDWLIETADKMRFQQIERLIEVTEQ